MVMIYLATRFWNLVYQTESDGKADNSIYLYERSLKLRLVELITAFDKRPECFEI